MASTLRFPGFIRSIIAFLGGIKTDTVSESTAAAGVTVDGCLIKDGAVAKVADAGWFASAEITGNGAAQATAHGLAAAPAKFFAVVTEHTDLQSVDIGAITADATNLSVTVTNGIKYRLYAML